MVNPTVSLDISVAGKLLGRVYFELFADNVPKIAANVHDLRTGEKVFDYKGCCFHRIILGFMCQGGDFTCHSGTGSKLMMRFHPEAFGSWYLVHSKYWTQHKWSPVFHLYAKTEWLDGNREFFSQEKDGTDIVVALECFGSRNDKANKKIAITGCGQL